MSLWRCNISQRHGHLVLPTAAPGAFAAGLTANTRGNNDTGGTADNVCPANTSDDLTERSSPPPVASAAAPEEASAPQTCATDRCSSQETVACTTDVSAEPGLLGMPGWHSPADLHPWVSSVLCRAVQLKADMRARGPGLPFLALLHDYELLLRNSHRPTRYCADFHPHPAWRGAAAAALTRLDAAYDELYGDADIRRDFEETYTAVEQLSADATESCDRFCEDVAGSAAADGGSDDETGHDGDGGFKDGSSGLDPLAAQLREELQRHRGLAAAGPGQWLQLCRAVQPLFRQHQQLHAAAAAAAATAAAAPGSSGAAGAAIATAASLHSTPPPHDSCGDSCAGPPAEAPAPPPDETTEWVTSARMEAAAVAGAGGKAAAEAQDRAAGSSASGSVDGGAGAEAGGGGGGGGKEEPPLRQLRLAAAQCSAALRRLAAGRPPLAPRLVLHPAQYEVLQPWLPDLEADEEEKARQGARKRGGPALHAAGTDGSGSGGEGVSGGGGGGAIEWMSGRELLTIWRQRIDGSETTSAEGSQYGTGEGVVHAADAGPGTQPQPRPSPESRRRKLVLYEGAPPLDLDERLLDATDAALQLASEMAAAEVSAVAAGCVEDGSKEARAATATATTAAAAAGVVAGVSGQPLPVVHLTPELAGRLLQLHPNEGLRWQVYHSGPLRQARALLAVLDHLAALRRQLAEALGYSCWTDLVLQGGGAAAGGGGGGVGGVGGSALGGRTAIQRMLQELGKGLLPYGESELMVLRRDARRLGGRSRSGGGGGLPPDADPLDPWNLPYVLQGLAQGQAASRYDTGWSAGYADYFSPPALLKGSDALCRALFGLALVGPLELSPGEAAGWVAEEEEPGQRRRAPVDGGEWEDGAQGRTRGDGGAGGGGGSGGGGGGDVILKATVVCCLTNQELGTLYLHLHGRLSEYPFTTLLRHGPAGRSGRVSRAAPADEVGLDGGLRQEEDPEGGAAGDDSRPVVLVRLPYKPDPESECGGPESPYFLKAWLHELGHALHHIASAAACRVTSASELISPPPPLPPYTPPSGTPPAAVPAMSTELATGAAATATAASQLPPSCERLLLALLSGCCCPLDVREVPSHLLEHALRDPGCLGLLSRHGRLDCPLPQRDCARLVAQLASCFTSTVGELQRLVAAALADQIMHGPALAPHSAVTRPPMPAGVLTAPPPAFSGSRRRGVADSDPAMRAHLEAHVAVCSLTAHHHREQLEAEGWATYSGVSGPDRDSVMVGLTGNVDLLAEGPPAAPAEALPPPPLLVAGPDVLHHLEAHGVLGGAEYVYVSSRLFAAAVWQRYLQDCLPRGPFGFRGSGIDQGAWRGVVGSEKAGGLFVRRRLLEAGAHVPGIEVLWELLGRDAFVWVPYRDGDLEAGATAAAHDDGGCADIESSGAVPAPGKEVRGGMAVEEAGGQAAVEGMERGAGCERSIGGREHPIWVTRGGARKGHDKGRKDMVTWACRSDAVYGCWVPDLAVEVFHDVDLLG